MVWVRTVYRLGIPMGEEEVGKVYSGLRNNIIP
jgi:hypothetical protein